MDLKEITEKSYFPDERAHPSVKADKAKFGLPVARAIFKSFRDGGQRYFFNKQAEYETWRQFAFGENDENEFKPSLGINPNDSKQTWLKAIRWEIKNYATKRVNVAVSRIHNRKYEAILEAIDKLSITKKEKYYARVQTVMDNRGWLQKISEDTGMNYLPEGMSEDTMPQTKDELEIHRLMNYKDNIASDVEKGIKHHLYRNNYEEKRRQQITDAFILGVGVPWVGMDENSRPIVKRLDPAKCVLPYSETPNFENLKYGGYIEEYDIGSFRKLHNGELTKQDEENIIRNFSKTYDVDYNYDNARNTYQRKDNIPKITVMHFEFKTVNEKVWVKYTDQKGNKRFVEKDYDYYRSSSQQKKFNEKFQGSRELVRKPYECVYEGYWVVGSGYIFRYGKKHNQERFKGKYGHLGQTSIGYKPYAPLMYNGRQFSTLKQMIPTLRDLQVYHLKVQHILSVAIPQGIAIDLHALSQAKLKWNQKELTDQQKIEMLMQMGILVFDSGGKHKPGSNYKPMWVENNGISGDLDKYLLLMQRALLELDEIIGENRVISGSNLHQDTGKGVAEYQIQAAETALEYLYNADQQMFLEISKSLAILHVQMLKYNPIEEFESSYGPLHYRTLTDPEFDISKVDFAFYVEAEPTTEEWNQFYLTVNEAQKAGLISLGDAVTIRQIDNLKQARAYLVVVEKRYKREQREHEIATLRANGEEQRKSEQQTHENKLQQIQAENSGKKEIELLALERAKLENDLEIRKNSANEVVKGDIESEHIVEEADQEIRVEKATANLGNNNNSNSKKKEKKD